MAVISYAMASRPSVAKHSSGVRRGCALIARERSTTVAHSRSRRSVLSISHPAFAESQSISVRRDHRPLVASASPALFTPMPGQVMLPATSACTTQRPSSSQRRRMIWR